MARNTEAEEQFWDESDDDEILNGRDEVRRGPLLLKLEGGADGKFKSHRIRILPPRKDSPRKRFYLWQSAHFKVGPNKVVVGCPAPDLFCPVCAEVRALRNDGQTKEADDLQAKTYGLVNVVLYDKETKKPEDKVRVWRVSAPTLTQLLNEIEDQFPDDPKIDSPIRGRDIIVRRTGTGQFDSKYEFRIAETASEFNGGEFGLLSKMYDLTTVFPKLAEEALVALVSGAPVAQLPVADDDDDEDVVEGEVRDLDEEEEPAPKVRKARAASPPPASTSTTAPASPTAPRRRAAASTAEADAAKARLHEELRRAAEEDDDDEDDEDEDED